MDLIILRDENDRRCKIESREGIKFAKTYYCSSFLRTPITPSIPSTAESSKQLAQARLAHAACKVVRALEIFGSRSLDTFMPPTTSDDDIAEHLPRGVGESWEPAVRRILFPCFLPDHLLIHNLIIYSLASLLYFDRYQGRPSQKESNFVRRANKVWEFLISFRWYSGKVQFFLIQDLDISFSASWYQNDPFSRIITISLCF